MSQGAMVGSHTVLALAADDTLSRIRTPDGGETGALDRVGAAAAAIEAARRELQEAVDQARAGGLSWSAIGRALGVSRQAAWERFSRRETV